jgi:hypothetical protein
MLAADALPQDVKQTDVYRRIRSGLDATPAIDTHEHLRSFDQMLQFHQARPGTGVTLQSLWQTSYWTRLHQVPPWPEDGSFDTWWQAARGLFEDGRANSVYRYLLPAFRNLYGIDFDAITDQQARRLRLAEAVAQRSTGQKQGSEQERVGFNHPLHIQNRRGEALLQRRQRHIDSGAIDESHARSQDSRG